MTEAYELKEHPQPQDLYMVVGWRQWADAGSVSSLLPLWLAQTTDARKIGSITPDGYYLFQIPGTHDLVRPVVTFDEGYPESLEARRNDFYYVGDDERGVVIFLGDEPHMDVERYVGALLDAAESLGVKRIVGMSGVYGELPYDKERSVSAIYSLPGLRAELDRYAVNLSDYEGGASIGSYVCRRAGDRGLEYVGFYAFVPTYEFSDLTQVGRGIRIENDFTAWHTLMQRVNYMFGTQFDLDELDQKSQMLVEALDEKVADIDRLLPDINLRAYMDRLSDEYEETTFDPADAVWAQAINRLFEQEDDERPGSDDTGSSDTPGEAG